MTRNDEIVYFETNRAERLKAAESRLRDAITRLGLIAETCEIIRSETFEPQERE